MMISWWGHEHEHEIPGLNDELPALLRNAAQAINTVSKTGVAILQNWCCDDERTAVASYSPPSFPPLVTLIVSRG